MKIVLRFLTLFVLIGLAQESLAQKEANNWYFGEYAAISFNSGSPVALTNGRMDSEQSCASISNSKGRLLFYTDGQTVWDSTHKTTPNGTGLAGWSNATQSGIIVPRPDSTGQYYIFTLKYV